MQEQRLPKTLRRAFRDEVGIEKLFAIGMGSF